MTWHAIDQVGMVYFMESAAFGEMTTFVYGTIWEQIFGVSENSVSLCTDLPALSVSQSCVSPARFSSCFQTNSPLDKHKIFHPQD